MSFHNTLVDRLLGVRYWNQIEALETKDTPSVIKGCLLKCARRIFHKEQSNEETSFKNLACTIKHEFRVTRCYYSELKSVSSPCVCSESIGSARDPSQGLLIILHGSWD